MAEFTLRFTETRHFEVPIQAQDPAEAEEEAREYWEHYSARYAPGGYYLTLVETLSGTVRRETSDEPPF